MAKGTMKAANSAGLAPETVEAIAAKNGVKNPGKILDTLAEIKTGRATITSPEEAASLKKTSREILDAAEIKSKTAATAEVQAKQAQIADLEAKGLKTQAQQLRNEVADYNAKAKAATEAVRGPAEPVTKTGSSSSKPVTTVEPGGKTATAGKLMKGAVKGAGLALGAYGIYEGYHKAKEEMEAKKQGDPKGMMEWTKEKAELAGRTFWHGLGFGGMAEIGTQAGKEAFEQYKKDVEAGKVSPKDWKPYLEMKGKALLGGLFNAGKAITYDAAKQSGTNLGNAIGEGVGAAKGLFEQLKSARSEQKTNEERSKEIYDKLIKNGASPVGAQRAADGVLKGDFTEAKRLNKVLEGKKAAKLAAAEPETKTRTYRDRKKLAAKKEAAKQETKAREGATDDTLKLRETVIGKLKAKGLPANAGMVDRLVAVLQRDGVPALDKAIAEMSGMQGTFSGSLGGRGSLRITVTGSKVTGSYSNTVSAGGITATARASISGDVELSSGTISMSMSGTSSAKGHSTPFSGKFSGSFTGNGYKGSSRGMGSTLSWSVSK
jgi:hypothetical protein